eukprot:TRINITY_DN78996_c0_g1_i1.p1 TRINITY_DN78996_c0_g1~~TRINITY_DN78996_c0_g1_i1.p1  ORF type:complete len:408 (-),score=131.02 TRINITY_DN78996_c0_g1_i1:88-1290(-)
MAEAAPDADALRKRLQDLLPAIQEAEKALDARRKQHEQLLEASSAAAAARDALAEAVQAPVCVAQAAANRALAEVAALEPAAVNEVRALAAPPKAVQRTLELIHAMVFGDGKSVPKVPPGWADLQKMLRRSDFLARIKGFRTKGSILENQAAVAQLSATYLGGAAGSGAAGAKKLASGAGPLTEEAVRRASQAVALLYLWAKAQLSLAPLLQEAEKAKAAAAAGETGASLSQQLSAAEAARARLEALAAASDLKDAMGRNSLASPVALLEAVHSADAGPQAVGTLQAQLQGAEALLSELQSRRAAKEEEVAVAKVKLETTQAESVSLEAEIEAVAAAAQAAGPPFCACELEMVRRECTDLVSPHYGDWCWRCPKGSAGCGQRIWDERKGPVEVPIGFHCG